MRKDREVRSGCIQKKWYCVRCHQMTLCVNKFFASGLPAKPVLVPEPILFFRESVRKVQKQNPFPYNPSTFCTVLKVDRRCIENTPHVLSYSVQNIRENNCR